MTDKPKTTGGVPFLYSESGYELPDPVITLRDYFAGQALAGLLANRTADCEPWTYKDMASVCYLAADTMLQVREQDR
jgi:hypothetical protein